MKKIFGQFVPVLLMLLIAASAFVYLNCSATPEPHVVSANDLGKIGKMDVSELTPTELQRLDQLINNEVSPCGNAHSLAQTILNPNLCPLTVHAMDYIMTVIKQDYNAEEVSAMYVARYASVKGLEIPRNGSPVMGATKPAISIVIFSDFECPHCARAADVVKQVSLSWPEHIQVVFKHYPIEEIHQNAMLGARAGYAAQQQGKFWELHDTLFSRSGVGFTPDTIRTMAIGLGMDPDEFEDDLSSDSALAAIKADMLLGQKLGVGGTPVIFVNGRILEGGARGLESRVKEEFLRMEFTAE